MSLQSFNNFTGILLKVLALDVLRYFNSISTSIGCISLDENLGDLIRLLIFNIVGCISYFLIVASMGSSISSTWFTNSGGIEISNSRTLENNLLNVAATSASAVIMFSFSMRVISLLLRLLSEKKGFHSFPKRFYYPLYS